MQTYLTLRRNGCSSGEELEEAAGRSKQTGDEMSDDIRWIRPEASREHAQRADLPVDEIIRVADTVVVRPDPESTSA